LRSIGDTVLATPTLHALRRFLPAARIDVLLEDWVAPVLEGHADVDRTISVERGSLAARVKLAGRLRSEHYDVAFNLHGGTTATFLTRASGARHRIGYADYRYARLHNHLAPPAGEVWGRRETHSVENNLALAGWVGVPVSEAIPLRLALSKEAGGRIASRLRSIKISDSESLALIHPAAAFDSKQWATENFALCAGHLHKQGFAVVALAAPGEESLVEHLRRIARVPVVTFVDLSLLEVVALAVRAQLFLGNDSGIAHIAAATATPSVVVFGSSHLGRWRPWTRAAYETVREEMPCQPCPGYTCREFGEAQCIRRVTVERVVAALDRVIMKSRVKDLTLSARSS
jgi:lipopolysaccharide heptosyltransferase II